MLADDDLGKAVPDAPLLLPSVKILASDPVALEGATSGAFTIIRAGDASSNLTVNFTISGSASNGVDYVTIPSSLTLNAGVLASNLVVQPIDDGAFDENKTVVLTLTTNANYRLSSRRKATVTIIDNVFNNFPPLVSLTKPADGTVVAAGANVTLSAEATDPDDPIKKVSFYANERLLGSATAAPYTLVWSNVPPGNFQLEARAVDQFGESAESKHVSLVVSNLPPVVNLIFPTNNTTLAQPAKIEIVAEASDPDGTVARVNFYANDHLIGTVKQSPYKFVWDGIPAGKFVIVAKAFDQFGTSSKSDPATLIVTKLPEPKVQPLPGAKVQLTFSVATDGTYQIEFSSDLKTWVVLGTVTSQNGQLVFTGDSSKHRHHGFYRAVLIKPATP